MAAVRVARSADGRLASGAHIPVIDDLPLTLVAAPTYVEIDALMKGHSRPRFEFGQQQTRLLPTSPKCLGGRSDSEQKFFLSPTLTVSIAPAKPS